jgi:thiamine-phosphate pyrophosphorylase
VTSAEPSLTLVSDRRRLFGRDLPSLAAEAARAGVDIIQLREKDLAGAALRELAARVVAAAEGSRLRVVINGRPDVACASGAHGVQLPEEGLPVADVRRAFPGLLVGASRHSLGRARRAEEDGADFVVFGPVFPTPGKEDRAIGLAALAEACRRLGIPVHAIGGVHPGNARRVLEAGAAGLAAIRPFLAGDLAATVSAFRTAS